MSPIDKLILGFLSPLKGLQLIFTSRKKFLLSIFPFILGTVVILGGFVWAFQDMGPMVESYLNQFEVLSGILLSIVTFFVLTFSWIAFFTFAFLLSYVAITIFGGPFYSMLAEDVFVTESLQGLKINTFRLLLTMFWLSLVKMILFLFLGLICFILSFVPILNIFSTYVVFLVIAFDCSDYAFEVDQLSLRQRFAFIFSHFWEYTGMVGAIMLTTFIPGSFFVLLPAFICGATKMYIQVTDK